MIRHPAVYAASNNIACIRQTVPGRSGGSADRRPTATCEEVEPTPSYRHEDLLLAGSERADAARRWASRHAHEEEKKRRSPWLNSIEPKGVHGKLKVVEPNVQLSGAMSWRSGSGPLLDVCITSLFLRER